MAHIAISTTYPNLVDGAPHKNVLAYTKSLERARATWSLVPNDAARTAEVLANCDGVLVTGGVDVDPARYGGRVPHAHAETDRYDADRDDFEFALVRAACEHGVPLLGICRGLQVINVAFGGTLVEDVREELGDAYSIEHRQTYDSGLDRFEYAPGHDVAIEPSSVLARIAGTTKVLTNSMHHQAVRAAGAGLRVVGRTADGVVEAIEPTFAHPYFVAVQWHPEELDDETSTRLFGGLVRAAAARPRQPA